MDRPDIAELARGFARMLRDQAAIILVCVAAALAAATVLTAQKDTVYEAQSKVLLHQDDPNQAVASGGIIQDPVRQRATALELITGPDLGQRVRRAARLRSFPTGVSAQATGDSNVIRITIRNKSRIRAVRIADAYAREFVKYRQDLQRSRYEQALSDVRIRIRRLQENRPPGAAEQIQRLQRQANDLSLLAAVKLPDATVIQRTQGFAREIKPRWVRNLLLAGMLALLLGLALAFLRDRLDDRVKAEADLANIFPGVPIIASVPKWRPSKRWRRSASEAYHNLAVSVRSFGERPGTSYSYLVTSAVGEDGKSTTAINLALALGREGRSAMLVDGDLRRPRITEMTNLPRGDGFVNVLSGESRLEDAAESQKFTTDQRPGMRRGRNPLVTIAGDLAVLPAGRTAVPPQRIINEVSVDNMIAQAHQLGRYTVVDGPPLGLFGDMLPVARLVDGVVVVVRLYHTRKRTLRNLARALETVEVVPIGIVLVGAGEQANTFYGA
jgi:Mrp family chromosome partitioning ATPase